MAFGRADRIDPKFAPLGTLKTAKNLRVRKDGRLACRNGYQPLDMDDFAGNDVVAYDLHEFSNGRLCALGASQGEGFPVDIYEYRGVPAATPWRPSDESGTYRPTLTPFTAPRSVAGIPQPSGGVNAVDSSSGGGYVCVAYRTVGGTLCHIQIVRESDDQVIFARDTASQGWARVRVAWGGDRFFFLGIDGSNNVELGSFTPGSSTTISIIATVATGFGPNATAFELNPVTNPTNSRVIVAYGLTAGTDVLVKRYNASGSQQGSTLTVAGFADVFTIDVEADEADNTVNLLVGEYSGGGGTVSSVELRTYNFSNSLLDGPTAMQTGYRSTMVRLPARTGWAEHLAVITSDIDSSGNLTVQWVDMDAHTVTATRVIGNAVLASAAIAASGEGQASGVVFGGFVEAEFNISTNALWYLSLTMAHMATRDVRSSARNAEDFFRSLGLSLDTSTGRLAWTSLFFGAGGDGTDIENFTVTTLALNSTSRRQGCSAGGLLYLAGGPVQVYDGRTVGEDGFLEIPGIRSSTQNTTGSLEQLATYSYVYTWEVNLPDGTFFESPPSPPFTITLTGSNDEVELTLNGPHMARVALGDATYGAEVTGVLYRTVWDSVNGSQGSQFHEVQRFTCPSTLADYGDDILIEDGRSDSAAATRAVLYTQAGPVEHNAPEMATYLSASSARISAAGLARTNEFQESKEQELDEGINFSNLSSFFVRAPNPINGILSLDGIRILFTRTDIYTVDGDGPENDASGALPAPVELASPGGLRDWRSLLKGPDGVWFQLDDSKLYRMPRGQGAPEWLGVDVQDTLALFPSVVGAARCRQDDSLLFACSAAQDARIVVRSLRTGIWTEDTPPLQATRGIEALSSFGDMVAYISGGIVYQLHPTSFADSTSTVIPLEWETHPLYPFEVGGNGKIHDVQMTGEFRSAGVLGLRVSYDNGMTFETYDSFTVTGLDAGAPVERRWSLTQNDIQSVVFDLTWTPSEVGEGLIVNALTLLIDPENGLKDLNPGEMA